MNASFPADRFADAVVSYEGTLRDSFNVRRADVDRDVSKFLQIASIVKEAIGWIDALAKETHGKTKSPSPQEVAELVVEMVCGAYGMEEAIPVVMAAYDLGEPARKPESPARIPVLQPIAAQVATFDPK